MQLIMHALRESIWRCEYPEHTLQSLKSEINFDKIISTTSMLKSLMVG